MTDRIWVKPAAGATVMEPRTKLKMPADGMFISVGDPHWMAHLHFGDIVESAAPKAHVDELDGMEKVEEDRVAAIKTKQKADADVAAVEAEEVAAAKAATANAAAPQSEPAAASEH